MGIFKRTKDIALAEINDLLDSCENPMAMLKQYIREVEEQINKAEVVLSNQLYIEKKYETLIDNAKAMVAKRTRQSELAVERNEDEIAKLALYEKLSYEKKLQVYHAQYASIKEQTLELSGQIKKLMETYEDLQTKKFALISRLNVARVTKNVNNALKTFTSGNALQGFDRMEEKILKLEAAANASNQLNQTKSTVRGGNLDGLLQEEVELELAGLKAEKRAATTKEE